MPSFFFNDTATTEIYTLSLHDALPIYEAAGAAGEDVHREPARLRAGPAGRVLRPAGDSRDRQGGGRERLSPVVVHSRRHQERCVSDEDRKSTRLNSRHTVISYAVFFF